MPKWNVSNAMDMSAEVFGYLTTDSRGVVIEWTPDDPNAKHFFDTEIGVETIAVMSSHLRNLVFTPREEPAEVSDSDGDADVGIAKGLEPARVIDAIANRTGESLEVVHRFVESAHHVVDLLVTDDVTVLAYPLIIAQPDCPVWERLRTLVKDETWTPPESWDRSIDEVATALRLPAHMLERYPVAGDAQILGSILQDLDLRDRTEERTCAKLYEAWIDTYETNQVSLRTYRVTPVGREEAFESWLIDNLEKLADAGLPVRLATLKEDGVRGRQPQLGNDSRADLVCRFMRDEGNFRQGDWLVIENKTTAVGSPVAAQLSRYVDWLTHRGVDGAVHGLLIADGMSVNLWRALKERDHHYLSLSRLGYRDVIRAHPPSTRVLETDPVSIPYPTSQRF